MADCSTRAPLSPRKHDHQWFGVVFAAQSVIAWSRTVVAEVIPTDQSTASRWQDTGTLGFDGNGRRVDQSELGAFRNSQPVQVSKQVSDVVLLPRVTYKTRRSIQDGPIATAIDQR